MTNILHDRILDGKGGIQYREAFYLEALYRGEVALGDFPPEPSGEIDQFQQCVKDLLGEDIFPAGMSTPPHSPEDWFIPEKYLEMDVLDFIMGKCLTEEEQIRVAEEWLEYERRNLIPILRFLIYLVDEMRARNTVWGVGRGSSVASMILYLIGITKVNPMKYSIPFREFIR